MSVVARFGWVVAAIVAAYFLAVLTYGFAAWVALAPHLWDDGLAGPIRTILVIMALAVMIFCAVQSDDKGVRGLWVFAAVALVSYSALKATGLADPDVPQYWLAHHVLAPLRHMAGLG
jgi:hypothetical protein